MKNLTVLELKHMAIDSIEAELDLCNGAQTPKVCALASDKEGRKKLINLILNYVGNSGQTIGEAILSIENELTPGKNEL